MTLIFELQKLHNVFHILAREPTTVREEGAGEELGADEEDKKRQKRFSEQLECMECLYGSDKPAAKNLLLDSDRVNTRLEML